MTANPTLDALQDLIEIVAKLRSPDGGCPWDLAQTPESLTPYVLEEAYEVVDAIQHHDPQHICEELGDLLLQILLQAQIASELGQFTLQDVVQGIAEKLIRRHPHVFGDTPVSTVEEVRQTWEAIKASEKATAEPPGLTDQLRRYSRTFPPLTGAMKISKKAAKVGFEWENIDGVWEKFQEELAEFKYALDHETKEQQESELGDLLFTIINIARWSDLDPAKALQGTNQRFIKRLQQLEAIATRPLSDYTLSELEALWQQAKAKLAQDS